MVPLRVVLTSTVRFPLAVTLAPSKVSAVSVLDLISLPVTVKSPPTVTLFLIVVIPVVAPITILVATPNILAVVTFSLNRFNEVVLLFTSPPSTFKSPSRSNVAFLIVVIPVVAPNIILAPASNTLAVVTLVLKRFNEVVLLFTSPPSTVKSPLILTSPRTSSFTVGLVVPIPTSALEVTTKTLPSVECPKAFAAPI